MKRFFSLLVVLVASETFAQDPGFVHHPAPVKPFYISESWYETLKAKTPPPPTKDSPEQKEDEKELRALQVSRTPKECERAQREVKANLQSLYGPTDGILTEKDVKSLRPFFDKIQNDADFFVQKLKTETTRPRPFTSMKDLKPCVPKEVTNAYPSGHAVIAYLFAAVLTDIFPAKKQQFQERAQVIGKDRILSGMHHPSDVETGKKLADFIYEEMKKSKIFQGEIKKIQNTPQTKNQ